MQPHDYFCLLNKEGKKCISELGFLFLHIYIYVYILLAGLLCDILKGFREQANQILSGSIAKDPPISAAVRSDIQPEQ